MIQDPWCLDLVPLVAGTTAASAAGYAPVVKSPNADGAEGVDPG